MDIIDEICRALEATFISQEEADRIIKAALSRVRGGVVEIKVEEPPPADQPIPVHQQPVSTCLNCGEEFYGEGICCPECSQNQGVTFYD